MNSPVFSAKCNLAYYVVCFMGKFSPINNISYRGVYKLVQTWILEVYPVSLK